MTATVLERDRFQASQRGDEEREGWFEVARVPGRTSPRSARRRLDFVIDESETLTPVPLVPFHGEVEAW